jgi:hypothetical protein
MRGAGSVDHRNFNKSDIAAVVDEGSISAGWNPKNEPLGSRGCNHAGIGNNGTGLVVRDSTKLAWLFGEVSSFRFCCMRIEASGAAGCCTCGIFHGPLCMSERRVHDAALADIIELKSIND